MDFIETLDSLYHQDKQGFIHQPSMIVDYLRTHFFNTLEEKIMYHQFSTMINIHNFIKTLYETNGHRDVLVSRLLVLAKQYTQAGLTPFTYSYMLYAVMQVFGFKSESCSWINPVDKSFKKIMSPTTPNDIGYGTKHESLEDFEIIGSKITKYNGSRRIVYIPFTIKTIAEETFKDCNSVEVVIMGESVKNIEQSAFSGCTKLRDIVLSKYITKLSSRVFDGCVRLKSLPNIEQFHTIGDYALAGTGIELFTDFLNVTSVGDYAFKGCKQLKEAYIDQQVTSIGVGAFCDCTDLEQLTLPYLGSKRKDKLSAFLYYSFGEDEASLGTSLNLKDVEVLNVPILNSGAFKGASSVKQLTLTSKKNILIPESAFEGCSLLESISYNQKIKAIGKKAFMNCKHLQDIDMDLSSLQKIDDDAFNGCESLPLFDFPSTLIEIGSRAFYRCLQFKTIVIPSNVSAIGYEALGSIPIETLELSLNGRLNKITDLFAHNQITGFNNAQLSETEWVANPPYLESITVNKGAITEEMFNHLTSVKYINLTKEINKIEAGAFKSTWSLQKIQLDGHKRYLSDNGILIDAIEHTLLSYPSQLENETYTVPKSIEAISSYAFDGAEYLKEIVLHEHIKEIQDYSFANCRSLEILDLPIEIKHVGKYIFKNCVSLKNLSVSSLAPTPLKKESYTFKDYFIETELSSRLPLESLRIKNGRVEGTPFAGLDNLKGIVFEEGVDFVSSTALDDTTIDRVVINCSLDVFEEGAFDSVIVGHITIKEFPATLKAFISIFPNQHKIETLRIEKGILGKNLLSSINVGILTLGTGVRLIESNCFNESKCAKLVIENNDIDIEKGAFFNAFIEDIECPDSSSYFFEESCLFDQHKGLVYLSESQGEVMQFSDKIESIYTGSISHVYQAQTIVFNEGILTVEENAITDCPFIETVVIKCNPKVLENDFMASEQVKNVLLDVVSVNKPIVNFFSQVEKIKCTDTVKSIGEGAFAHLQQLVSIELPDALDYIGPYAFSHNALLEKIVIPKTVTYIGVGVFSQSSSLKEISIPFINPLEKLENLTGSFGSYFSIHQAEGLEPLTVSYSNHKERTVYIPSCLESVIITGGTLTDSCFSGCGNIPNLMIESYEGDIPKNAFAGCTQLTHFTLSESTKSIDSEAFKDCRNLEEIVGLEHVDEIHPTALENCDNVRRLSFGPTIQHIPIHLLDSCKQLKTLSVLDNPYYSVEASMLIENSSKTLIYCPRSIEETNIILNNVEVIGVDAFKGNLAIEQLIFTGALKVIKKGAFNDMHHLKSLVLPNSVLSLPGNLLEGNEELTNLVIPFVGKNKEDSKTFELHKLFGNTDIHLETLQVLGGYHSSDSFKDLNDLVEVKLNVEDTSIKPNAFKGLSSLKTVELSSTIITIEDNAFEGASQLETINFEYLRAINNKAFKDCSSLTISNMENVEIIGDGAFSNCHSINEIDLNKGITAIGEEAFSGCIGIKKVSINATLDTFKQGVFYQCPNITFFKTPFIGEFLLEPKPLSYLLDQTDALEEVIVTNGPISKAMFEGLKHIRYIQFLGDILVVQENAFKDCINLEQVKLPDTIEEISSESFSGCASLRSLKLPNALRLINDRAFKGCTSLSKVDFSKGLKELGDEVFSGCTGLESLKLHNMDKIGKHILQNTGQVKELVLPFLGNGEGQNQTLNYTFDLIDNHIETLIIKNGNLDLGAFSGYEGLKNVTLPLDLKQIPDHTFEGCKSVESITLPPHVSSIGKQAFKDCESLIEIKGSDWVDVMGEGVFLNCRKLKSVRLSPTLKHIPKGCFKDCVTLDYVDLGQALEVIDSEAFSNCESLQYMTIPSSLKRIEDKAFSRCISLEKIDISELEYVGDYAFLECDKQLIINVKNETQVGNFSELWDNKKLSAKDEKNVFKKLSNQMGKKHKKNFIES